MDVMPCHLNLCFQNTETCLKSHQPSISCYSNKSKFSCTLNRFVPPVPTSLCKQAHIFVYSKKTALLLSARQPDTQSSSAAGGAAAVRPPLSPLCSGPNKPKNLGLPAAAGRRTGGVPAHGPHSL